jgi:dTDP-4-amino-4,6-dideoxygalactose transaminase
MSTSNLGSPNFKVPFIDMQRLVETSHGEILAAVESVLNSGHFVLGKNCEEFEKFLGRSFNAQAVGCNSGTDAIVLSLLALGVGPGDEVIVPSMTAIPTVSAVIQVGATPVLVDVDPDHWTIHPDLMESAITPKTKAVIAVHLYGNAADSKAILKKTTRIALIEDLAQSHGTTLSGKPVGSYGRFGAMSFYPTKNLGAIGDGGAVICHSDSDKSKLKSLRAYGEVKRYEVENLRGVNSRLDELQAAILLVQSKNLEKWNQRKVDLYDRYFQALKQLPIQFQKLTPECKPAWHLAVIRCESEGVRDQLKAHLQNRGIQTLIHYPRPCHEQPGLTVKKSGDLKTSSSLSKTILSLPLYAQLKDSEQSLVIEETAAFFNG